MKKGSEINVRSIVEHPDMIELVDVMELSESAKNDVIIPYIGDLQRDLSHQSPTRAKGISRGVFLEVRPPVFDPASSSTCRASWANACSTSLTRIRMNTLAGTSSSQAPCV